MSREGTGQAIEKSAFPPTPASGRSFLLVELFQRGADGGNHKGGKGAVFALNGFLNLFDHLIGEPNGFIHRGRSRWYFKCGPAITCNMLIAFSMLE